MPKKIFFSLALVAACMFLSAAQTRTRSDAKARSPRNFVFSQNARKKERTPKFSSRHTDMRRDCKGALSKKEEKVERI